MDSLLHVENSFGVFLAQDEFCQGKADLLVVELKSYYFVFVFLLDALACKVISFLIDLTCWFFCEFFAPFAHEILGNADIRGAQWYYCWVLFLTYLWVCLTVVINDDPGDGGKFAKVIIISDADPVNTSIAILSVLGGNFSNCNITDIILVNVNGNNFFSCFLVFKQLFQERFFRIFIESERNSPIAKII